MAKTPKKIVVCCDGTWNQVRRGNPTNVAKFRYALADHDDDGVEQLAEYFDGVGTAPFTRILGGAFGAGLNGKIKEAYRFVATNYTEGDLIYVLGFSRGAYTARSLAGLVRNIGIVKDPGNRLVMRRAFKLYRDRSAATAPDSTIADRFIARHTWRATIHFIGVWDTVGALGIPIAARGPQWLREFNNRYAFHDTTLSGTVPFAFQALAVDERRGPFAPAVWDSPAGAGQTVRQAWFSGAHSDVGGGYAETGLSDLTLQWMARAAGDAGLRFLPGTVAGVNGQIKIPGRPPVLVRPNSRCRVHNSRTLVYRLVKPLERDIVGGIGEQCAAWSAADRLQNVKRYAPATLTSYLRTNPSSIQY